MVYSLLFKRNITFSVEKKLFFSEIRAVLSSVFYVPIRNYN